MKTAARVDHVRTPARATEHQPRRRGRGRYSPAATALLGLVWEASGEQCGKYLCAMMPELLASLERHGELVRDDDAFGDAVRAELCAMSAATIDRHLAVVRRQRPPRMVARGAVQHRPRPTDRDPEPGYFDADVLLHDDLAARVGGVVVRLTDAHTGWSLTRAVPGLSAGTTIDVFRAATTDIPFAVTAVDLDPLLAGVRDSVAEWARAQRTLVTCSPAPERSLTRSIPPAHVPKATDLAALAELCALEDEHRNQFVAIRRPCPGTTPVPGRPRAYDAPSPPLTRLLAAGVLSPRQGAELRAAAARRNPAALARRIQALRSHLAGRPAAYRDSSR